MCFLPGNLNGKGELYFSVLSGWPVLYPTIFFLFHPQSENEINSTQVHPQVHPSQMADNTSPQDLSAVILLQ